jgi:hypothetical protein
MEDQAIRRTQTLASHLGNEDSLESTSSVRNQTEYVQEKLETKTIQAERRKTNFDVRKLTYIYDGDEEFTKLKEIASLAIERDPILNDGLKVWNSS